MGPLVLEPFVWLFKGQGWPCLVNNFRSIRDKILFVTVAIKLSAK